MEGYPLGQRKKLILNKLIKYEIYFLLTLCYLAKNARAKSAIIIQDEHDFFNASESGHKK